MAQHDYSLANQSGSSFRSDLNNALLAISSSNSGSSAPSTTYAYELWVDTSNNLLKLRNGANNAWLTTALSTTASNTVDIDGGSIDGSAIGANSASTVVCTSLTATLASSIITTDNSTNLLLGSTDTDSSSAPVLEMYRNSASPADGDAVGLVYWTGENDADEKVFYGQIYTRIEDASDGSEDTNQDFITLVEGTGRSRMYFTGGSTATTCFNEAGVDIDFRVESDTNANALKVDAGENVVLVGTGTKETQGVTIYANGVNGHYLSVTGTVQYLVTNVGQSSTTGTLQTFYNNATATGGIIITSTNVTNYTSVSDYRLKENVSAMTGATERLKQLNPVTFDWKNTGESSEGFLAHEVDAVVDYAVTGTKDEIYDAESAQDNPMVSEGDAKYQCLDPAKLVPLLVKTTQELEARITTLEGK
jgi:hypothetical protein|tara:strand:- start:13 stop:1272 length:1260 start_codon:yes stop_codon:yes gene_type:complete